MLKDFGPDNTFKWSPVEREGMYTVEVAVSNLSTGQQSETIVPYTVTSNVTGGNPVLKPTSHPLVFLYSAPPCPAGNSMIVYYLNPKTGILQNTPSKRCNGLFSQNFYIAGLRGSTFYYVRHHLENNGVLTEGPLLSFTSGAVPADVPQVTGISGHSEDSSQVLLAGSLFTKFVATDLSGNTIWYYPDSMLFLTRPQPGGFFFGIDENQKGDQSKQILREFDLAGMTMLETNAARINEQLAKLGKRQISGLHHEARRTSDGRIILLATVEQIAVGLGEPAAIGGHHVDPLGLRVEQHAVERVARALLGRGEERLGDELLERSADDLEVRFSLETRHVGEVGGLLREYLEVRILPADVGGLAGDLD